MDCHPIPEHRTPAMSKPFRWTISKREQLGNLPDLSARRRRPTPEFLADLRNASARVLAMSDGAHLGFVGRSPENFFDYLSGVFDGAGNAPQLHLIQFSMRWPGEGGVEALPPRQVESLFEYFHEEGIDAAAISRSNKPLALVDFVARGGTFQTLVSLLRLQAQQQGVDWNAVSRKLRLIGLRARTKNSPNTWRWQQHQDWLHLLKRDAVMNVSAPGRFLYYIANEQPKVTRSHHLGRWNMGAQEARVPDPDQANAIAIALELFGTGNTKRERQLLASLIARLPQMKQQATRSLVTSLKRSQRA